MHIKPCSARWKNRSNLEERNSDSRETRQRKQNSLFPARSDMENGAQTAFQPMTSARPTPLVLHQLSCQANWEKVVLRVQNITVDDEDCKWKYERWLGALLMGRMVLTLESKHSFNQTWVKIAVCSVPYWTFNIKIRRVSILLFRSCFYGDL